MISGANPPEPVRNLLEILIWSSDPNSSSKRVLLFAATTLIVASLTERSVSN